VPQYEALKDRPHRKDWPAGDAIEFMRRTILARPGEITLLTIGPLTNVALLFALDPEIPSLLKQVVSMAGVFFGKEEDSEWNCRVDPVATAMVYAARPPRHVSIGLDVTMKCRMTAAEMRARFTAPPLNFVLEMAEVWFRGSKEMTFHDPLAAAVIFRPELCGYEDGTVAVDCDREDKLAGRTRFVPAAAGSHRVARTVDPAAFFAEYFSVFG
jgi:purine nucleosidase